MVFWYVRSFTHLYILLNYKYRWSMVEISNIDRRQFKIIYFHKYVDITSKPHNKSNARKVQTKHPCGS